MLAKRASFEEKQVDPDWRDKLKAIIIPEHVAIPAWVELLEARDFTKAFARIRERVPANHPWKELPEKTLELPLFKIIRKKQRFSK